MGLHDYGLHCERCGRMMTLRESANGGLCNACLVRAALEDDEKRPPEVVAQKCETNGVVSQNEPKMRGNARRYNEDPNSGMVADDLGRWVKWEQYRRHVCWLAKRLEEATGIHKGAWLEMMRKEA